MGHTKIFLIILLLIVAISALVIPSFGIWRDTAKSICVMEQFSYLRSLENAVKNAKERDSVYPEFKLKVMYCIDCIWYDTDDSSLMIKISEQDTPAVSPIEANFIGIGCDCDDCDGPKADVDDNDVDEECSNLRKDTTYAFEITKDYAKFLGYLKDDAVEMDLSSQGCGPCVGYEEECGYKKDSEWIPCCSGLGCEKHPGAGNLKEVDWLGKTGDESIKSWSGKICLKSLREECSSYKECSIFQISEIGTKAQYPCHTIGDDPTNRCCYPLQKKVRVEGLFIYPATDCSGYGGCEVYCGDVKCGYVYSRNPTGDLEKSPNMCCKPLGEECWYTQNNWQCCAHELLIKNSNTPPTQCLEDDGDLCAYGSTNCHCCISENYNCTPDTASYCCADFVCKDTGGGTCEGGEKCKCLP